MKPEMNQVSIVPALMPERFSDIAPGVERYAAFATWIQLDVTDGVFAPHAGWPYGTDQWSELEELAQGDRTLPQMGQIHYEAHLMVTDPERIGELLARGGVENLIVHVEALEGVDFAVMCASWRAARVKQIGLAILSSTPLETLAPYLDQAQFIQVMGIERIGSQGQPFSTASLGKVRALRAMYPSVPIEFDGGVGLTTISSILSSGVSRIVVGSALSDAADPALIYQAMQQAAVDNLSAGELI